MGWRVVVVVVVGLSGTEAVADVVVVVETEWVVIVGVALTGGTAYVSVVVLAVVVDAEWGERGRWCLI